MLERVRPVLPPLQPGTFNERVSEFESEPEQRQRSVAETRYKESRRLGGRGPEPAWDVPMRGLATHCGVQATDEKLVETLQECPFVPGTCPTGQFLIDERPRRTSWCVSLFALSDCGWSRVFYCLQGALPLHGD